MLLAKTLAGSVPHFLDHRRKAVFTVLVKPQLAWIGPTFGHNRCCLTPDKPCATGGESLISAERQFPWPALRIAVAALHRMHSQRIRYQKTASLDRLSQN
jgi:hypothetical protein